MNSHGAATTYREAAFEHAPPLKVLRMMYQGAIRFLDQAKDALGRADFTTASERLLRVDAIVCELRLGLNHDVSPGLSSDLEALYIFVEGQIRQAIEKREALPIDNSRRVLNTLLEGWKQVEVEGERYSQAG